MLEFVGFLAICVPIGAALFMFFRHQRVRLKPSVSGFMTHPGLSAMLVLGLAISVLAAAIVIPQVRALAPSWVCPEGGSLGLSSIAAKRVNRGGSFPECFRGDIAYEGNVFLYLALVTNVAFFAPLGALRLVTRGARRRV